MISMAFHHGPLLRPGGVRRGGPCWFGVLLSRKGEGARSELTCGAEQFEHGLLSGLGFEPALRRQDFNIPAHCFESFLKLS